MEEFTKDGFFSKIEIKIFLINLGLSALFYKMFKNETSLYMGFSREFGYLYAKKFRGNRIGHLTN